MGENIMAALPEIIMAILIIKKAGLLPKYYV